MSASQMVAMPCSATASTEIHVAPIEKSIGAERRDLARRKMGQDIRSCALRAAMSTGIEENRSSCCWGLNNRSSGAQGVHTTKYLIKDPVMKRGNHYTPRPTNS